MYTTSKHTKFVNVKWGFIDMDEKAEDVSGLSIELNNAIGIQGKLLRMSYSHSDWLAMQDTNEIKRVLVEQLTKFLLEDEGKNYITFTKSTNPQTFQTNYMVTLCLTPNNQTQLIINSMKNKNLL